MLLERMLNRKKTEMLTKTKEEYEETEKSDEPEETESGPIASYKNTSLDKFVKAYCPEGWEDVFLPLLTLDL